MMAGQFRDWPLSHEAGSATRAALSPVSREADVLAPASRCLRPVERATGATRSPCRARPANARQRGEPSGADGLRFPVQQNPQGGALLHRSDEVQGAQRGARQAGHVDPDPDGRQPQLAIWLLDPGGSERGRQSKRGADGIRCGRQPGRPVLGEPLRRIVSLGGSILGLRIRCGCFRRPRVERIRTKAGRRSDRGGRRQGRRSQGRRERRR